MFNKFDDQRPVMVREQVFGRGVRDEKVLAAMGAVRREVFAPPESRDFAYYDNPLPLVREQVMPQPYITAFMIEALQLHGGEKVLELGAGSGYGAAVLARIAGQVYTVEPVADLAETARKNLAHEGVDNVRILTGDTDALQAAEAPYDAILLSEPVAEIPENLKPLLRAGGHLVAIVGGNPMARELVRLTRRADGGFDREDLADIRFVPSIDEKGADFVPGPTRPRIIEMRPRQAEDLPGRIVQAAQVFDSVEEARLDDLIERAGDSRIVLLGEASHGTSEFYRMRDRITRRLITEKGFNIVAVEADWPDAARIDDYVRHADTPASEWQAFARFPTWMWRNEEVRGFVDWLHEHNRDRAPEQQAGFYGLDMYSLYNSAQRVIEYLDGIDPALADIARRRYGCLSPWESDPAAYGHAALTGKYRECEDDVVNMLTELFRNRKRLSAHDGERFMDAAQNAKLVADAERYYRIMYYGSNASWNLRDSHMYETLRALLDFRGPGAKAVVWAHNSHIGDAAFTEMSARGEFNIGQLVRKGYAGETCHIGFGTDHGTVAAASNWDSPMEVRQVRPAHPQSFERLFHRTGKAGLVVPLRARDNPALHEALKAPRLERAIGVIYRPETELASHYFEANLSEQFDEYIWIDETRAVTPLDTTKLEGLPDLYPFGV